MESLQAKKNVLLVVRWPVGGIRTYLKYVLRLMSKSDVNFYLVTVKSESSLILQEDISDYIAGYSEVVDNNFYFLVFREIFRINRNVNLDAIHAHGFTSAVISLLPSVVLRIPLILTSHDVVNSSQFKGWSGLLKKYLLKLTLMRCKEIQSVSNDSKRNLADFFPSLKDSKLTVIKNGIDTDRFKSAIPASLKQELGLKNGELLVGFFGRFMNQKGFRYLVEAVEILASQKYEHKVHVVCFGSGAYEREEKEYIKKKNLSSQFDFMPFTPDISPCLKACDLVVMPSLWEACPLQPMEALCAGVPFVGSDCIGLREVVAGTPAFTFKTADSQALADSIKRCVAQGKVPFLEYSNVACDRFSVSKTADELSLLYRRVLFRENKV